MSGQSQPACSGHSSATRGSRWAVHEASAPWIVKCNIVYRLRRATCELRTVRAPRTARRA
eukprot:1146267-Prymnesium_polylepis.1